MDEFIPDQDISTRQPLAQIVSELARSIARIKRARPEAVVSDIRQQAARLLAFAQPADTEGIELQEFLPDSVRETVRISLHEVVRGLQVLVGIYERYDIPTE